MIRDKSVGGFIRENYPLGLAFATTIHFAQGSTTDSLVVFGGKCFNNNTELL